MKRRGLFRSAQVPPPGIDLSGLKPQYSFLDAPDAFDIAWSADGTLLAVSGTRGEVIAWSADANSRRSLGRHETSVEVTGLSWHPDLNTLATGADDGTVYVWDLATDASRRVGTSVVPVRNVAWSPDGHRLAATHTDGAVSIMNAVQGGLLARAQVHKGTVYAARWSADGRTLVTCGADGAVNVLDGGDLRLLGRLTGHTGKVLDVALSPDGSLIASSGADSTIRVWDLVRQTETAILEGHVKSVFAVRFSPDGGFLASASTAQYGTVRGGVWIWRCRDWARVAELPRDRFDGAGGLAFHPSRPLLAVKELGPLQHRIDCYEIDYGLLDGTAAGRGSHRYGNAKVVLLGDTGVGKSGLGLVLSGQQYRPTDSTHGRNVWTLDAEEAPVSGGGTATREVLLWDLAGQPGYRLIHQLHLNEVAVALVVFDSRSETDPFAGVKYWVRALAQARRLEGAGAFPLKAYLVAARADRGGVGVTADRVMAMVEDLGLDGFFETSAKEGWQITHLAQAIRDGIAWDALPTISSSVLFESIKQFLLEEKQQGRLLATVDDLFRGFRRVHTDEASDSGLRPSFETCVGRMESRGLIRRLQFGDLVLLQPELLDAYASAMVQSARAEPDGLGFIAEEIALAGRFRLPEQERVLDPAQEKLLLIATVEELLRHEIALKEVTDRGVDLVFPSQFTKERPDAPDIPGKEVIFAFEGPLHSVYATLAVRLSHSTLFERQAMWQNAASYKATVGGICGIHLREVEEGRGELVLFYDERASRAVRSQFETYVAGHLQLRGLPGTLTRRAIKTCSGCGFILPDDLVLRRLDRGATSIRCPACEETGIPLTDEPADVTVADVAVAEMNRSADERRDQNAAALLLKGKIETADFDVFLCYNSRDREQVTRIGGRLKERGILPWLDVWEIRPGTRWQQDLRRRIKSIKSAAVFIGPTGAGPWQELEVESLLAEIARRHRPIIPVILDGRQGRPRLPAFLDLWHVVDMREAEPDPFGQLLWGITGDRPEHHGQL
ncbi:MAG TPA: TIR domain-containing protein [Streptosporangiaceae bacterium]